MNKKEPISIFDGIVGDHFCLTVEGECLYAALGVKRDFMGWLKKRIADYHFVEGQDFVTVAELSNGKESRQYILSLGMAKELCMLEKSEQGRELRRYLIETEKHKKLEDKSLFLQQPSADRVRDAALSLQQHMHKAGKASRELGRKRADFHKKTMAVRGIRNTPHFELLDQIERSNEMTFRALDDLAESIARNVEAMRILTEDIT